MYVLLAGSSHTEVPVNPVWPNESTGNKSPRGDEYANQYPIQARAAPEPTADVCTEVIL